MKKFVNRFYKHAASHCGTLDVRVLLSNISNTTPVCPHKLHKAFQVSLVDSSIQESATPIAEYVRTNFMQSDFEIKHLKELPEENQDDEQHSGKYH